MLSANTYCPQKNLGPNTNAVTRRTSSVRRNFAAISDRSPKQSPLAALLPAKETCKPKPASHTRLLGCKCPSALSFLLAKSSHLGQRKRIATALPRAENRFRNTPMNAFAFKSAGASAPVLIEPRSPHYGFRLSCRIQPPTKAPCSRPISSHPAIHERLDWMISNSWYPPARRYYLSGSLMEITASPAGLLITGVKPASEFLDDMAI